MERLLLVCVLAGVLTVGCGGGSKVDAVKSGAPRATVSEEARADAQTLASENAAFAWDLFKALASGDGNLFSSPFSASEALAMVYAGAKGNTASEMEKALHLETLKERTHPAFNALDQDLTAAPAKGSGGFRLSIANAAWAQKGHPFERSYLDTLAVNYGSGVRLADFVTNAESARLAINDQVAKATQQRIKDLMPAGSVTSDTRLVLTNAIYFKADWEHKFPKEATRKAPFKLLDGATVAADLMYRQGTFAYLKANDVEIVELPYAGGRFAMVILLPAEGKFGAVEASLDGRRAGELIAGLKSSQIGLSVPRFSFSSTFRLDAALKALGMVSLFTGEADLSGMDGQHELFVSGVFHSAFVKVDEEGTEAAAATGAAAAASAPALNVRVDRPFIFLIRDRKTGALLFIGRVLDPTREG